jgi:hypothetical protein
MPSTICQNNNQRLRGSLGFLLRLRVLLFSIQHFPGRLKKASRNCPDYHQALNDLNKHLKNISAEQVAIVKDLHTEIEKLEDAGL